MNEHPQVGSSLKCLTAKSNFCGKICVLSLKLCADPLFCFHKIFQYALIFRCFAHDADLKWYPKEVRLSCNFVLPLTQLPTTQLSR